MTTLNTIALAKAKDLIKAGKVNLGTFDFTAADGDRLLGPQGDNWTAYASYHLGIHGEQLEHTRARYGYPYGKDGEVYRNAVISGKGRAAQHDEPELEDAFSQLYDLLSPSHVPPKKEARMNKAYAPVEFKFVGDEASSGELTLQGTASTPGTDLMGDIVVPEGAQYKLPLPFLFMHDSHAPIGTVTAAKVSKSGIQFTAKVVRAGVDPVIDRARNLLREGLMRGVSIGFKSVESQLVDPKEPWGGVKFLKWLWLELSAVVIPANEEATITSIKSFDEQSIAAQAGSVAKPIAAGAASIKPKERAMNLKEQIASFEATRAAKQAAADNMMKDAGEKGQTLSPDEATEHDQLIRDVDAIDAHLKRLNDMEKRNGSASVAVVVPDKDGEARTARPVRQGDFVLRATPTLPPGIGMARYVKAFAFARGNYQQAAEYAKQWDDSTPEVGLALKAAISAGTTTDSVWAGPLVYAQDFPAAFLDYLRPKTIIGKIPNMQHVPFNIRYGIQDGTSTVAWVGQGAPKPVSKLTFTSGSLGFAKAAGIVVITQELARFSSPSAELKVRNDLTGQMVTFLDQQFIDPSVAAVANVSPASVTNGATAVRQSAAAWTTQQAVLTDVKALLAMFSGVEVSFTNAVWVTTPDVAISLSLLLNTAGTDFAFPGVSVNGGTFAGMPLIVSNAVPHSTSSGSIMVLIIPEWIYMADEGGIAIDQSVEASLQMDTAPTNNSSTPTATTLVSMFQTNSIAIRVERVINWQRARTYGAGYIDNLHTS